MYRFSCHRRNLKLGIIEQRKFKLLAELGNVRLRPIAILPHVTIVRAVPSPSIARHVTLLHTADGDTASAGKPPGGTKPRVFLPEGPCGHIVPIADSQGEKP